MYSDFFLPGLFFVPVKWNPNFVSWSPLESLQRRGAGMWVMAGSLVRAHDIMTVVTTLSLCVTVTRDTDSVLRPEHSAQWKLSKAFILSLPMAPGAYLKGQPWDPYGTYKLTLIQLIL